MKCKKCNDKEGKVVGGDVKTGKKTGNTSVGFPAYWWEHCSCYLENLKKRQGRK